MAQSLPWRQCGARFTDLDYTLPPLDHPEEPVYRQRGPEREQAAKAENGYCLLGATCCCDGKVQHNH